MWADLDLSDPDQATAEFVMQVDRQGRRQPLKTEAAERSIELPRALAQLMIAHKLRTLPHWTERVRVRRALRATPDAA